MLALCRHVFDCTFVTAAVVATISTFSEIATPVRASETETPIEHVIVVIGENRSFDHLFATYTPLPGQTVWNLLSKGIITAEGTPAPNFGLASQFQGSLKAPSNFSLTPSLKASYKTLPPPLTDGAPTAASDTKPAPFASLAAATAAEGQALLASDLPLLTSGATKLPQRVIDTRILNVNQLPSGPFQLTPGVSYDDYTGGPVHRFYQMWQQLDCGVAQAAPENPSGCLADLFAWVEVSIGAGSNGKTQPADFSEETTGEGATAMGFYNVQKGDTPYFTQLAREYTISDNYHQPVMGGTGANSSIILATAAATR